MLMSPKTAQFIAAHRTEDVRDLALKVKRTDGLDLPFALDQIAGWQTAQTKLPEWAACDGIIYPPHLSMEQCSSQFTARYKAEIARRIATAPRLSASSKLPNPAASHVSQTELTEQPTPVTLSTTPTTPEVPVAQSASNELKTSAVPAELGTSSATKAWETSSDPTVHAVRTTQSASIEPQTQVATASSAPADTQLQPLPGCFVDLTGGFGVDCSYLARAFTHAMYVERQPHLCELAEHNMRALGLNHVTVINGDAETVLTDLRNAHALAQRDTRPGSKSASSTLCPQADADVGADTTGRPNDAIVADCGAMPSLTSGPQTDMDTDITDSAESSHSVHSQPDPARLCPALAGEPTAPVSLIFIDPARRDAHGGRTVAIEDCTPNVLALRDQLLAAAPHVMIKLSPMLDWRKAVADFRGAVAEIHIVATGNECKELLLVLDCNRNTHVRVYCVNDSDRLDFMYHVSSGQFARTDGRNDPSVLAAVESSQSSQLSGQFVAAGGHDNTADMTTVVTAASQQTTEFNQSSQFAPINHRDDLADTADVATASTNSRDDSTVATIDTTARPAAGSSRKLRPITYLYEPNAAIMKAGCFALIEDRYRTAQIGPNSHLFVSSGDQPITDFPGRVFAVDTITTLSKRDVKSALNGVTRANIAVRNFPLTVAQLRKKLRLGDGGDVYLFATTLAGAKHVLIRCHKP